MIRVQPIMCLDNKHHSDIPQDHGTFPSGKFTILSQQAISFILAKARP